MDTIPPTFFFCFIHIIIKLNKSCLLACLQTATTTKTKNYKGLLIIFNRMVELWWWARAVKIILSYLVLKKFFFIQKNKGSK